MRDTYEDLSNDSEGERRRETNGCLLETPRHNYTGDQLRVVYRRYRKQIAEYESLRDADAQKRALACAISRFPKLKQFIFALNQQDLRNTRRRQVTSHRLSKVFEDTF